MTGSPRPVRRQRVDEGPVLVIAAIAGAAAAFAGARPTGAPTVDVALAAVVAAAVTWASASAPWWASAAAAGVGATIALQPAMTVVGSIGFLGGLAVGLRRDVPPLRAVIGGVAVNVLLRSELDGFFGLPSIVGIATGAALFGIGVWNRPPPVRRVALTATLTVAGLAVLAIALAGVTALSARSDVTGAASSTRAAITALDEGDYDEAAELFDDASSGFRGAADALGGTLAGPAYLLPGLAQNLRAGDELASTAAEASEEAADALRDADLSSVRFVDGRVDVDAVRALEEPLLRLDAVLGRLATVTDDVGSPWLIQPLQRELDELAVELLENEDRLDNAIAAVRVAPAVLGGEGQRRYLVLFTTPAEARGLGGFIGNYAELTAVDGRITVSEFGRRSLLEEELGERPAFCSGCPDELLARYGRFGFESGPDGSVQDRTWSNLTMPAHFPYVAESAAVLYPQSGGAPIDGVIVMDPYVIEALMAFTGPIDIPGAGLTVEPEEAAEFILVDQYLIGAEDDGEVDNERRIDALQVLGEGVVARLLATSLPDPPDLARALSPMIAERRLLMWTVDEAERDVLDRIGALGALPPLGDDGGFSVSVTNSGASKIDVFLDRSVDVDVEAADDGSRLLTATVTLTNNAPTGGLPDVVIGNLLDLPTGTSRLFVTMYGPPRLVSASLDGVPVQLEPSTEAGWSAYGDLLDLAPGQSAVYVLVFELPRAEPGSEGPVLFEQPLAARDP